MLFFDKNKILEDISENIDITNTQKENIRSAYYAVGEYLDRDDSPIKKYTPTIFPQGSIALGTVVKPVLKDECDVDIVCLLEKLSSDIVSPANVKQMVGKELKGHGTYFKMLDKEGKRCWTLHYSDKANFHMDILPAIKQESAILNQNTLSSYVDDAIKATNKDPNTNLYSYIDTNPKGYIQWFRGKTIPEIKSSRMKILLESMEQYPEHLRKMPLQRVIQLFKRHRDVMFDGDENKPISIILTTLSGHAYAGDTDVYIAACKILKEMLKWIRVENNQYIILNPVCNDENFCDKWSEKPVKAKAFLEWHRKITEDFQKIESNESNRAKLINLLGEMFDTRTVNPVFDAEAQKINTSMKEGLLAVDSKTGGLIPAGGTIPAMKIHRNFGE